MSKTAVADGEGHGHHREGRRCDYAGGATGLATLARRGGRKIGAESRIEFR